MELKFLVDENCLQLAKWLRFYGLDAIDARDLSTLNASDKAIRDDRILITRNQELWHMHPGQVICLYTNDLREQIKAVFEKLELPDESQWFSRCVLCNQTLEPLPADEVKDELRIPKRIKENKKEFWRCPNCRRLYWEGSHFDRTQGFLKEIAKELHSP